jgi:hypothetical protein
MAMNPLAVIRIETAHSVFNSASISILFRKERRGGRAANQSGAAAPGRNQREIASNRAITRAGVVATWLS